MKRCDCPTEIEEEKLRAVLQGCAPRDRLIVELGFKTGLRVAELVGLKVGEVWNGAEPSRVLRLARSRLKGGRGVRARQVNSRTIPLNARAREAIAAAVTFPVNPAASLFPSREGNGAAISPRQAIRIIRRIFLQAGLPADGVWAGHSLRRRFVVRIYEKTRDINLTRAAIGHRYLTTTMIYLGNVDQEANAAILSLGEVRGNFPVTAKIAG